MHADLRTTYGWCNPTLALVRRCYNFVVCTAVHGLNCTGSISCRLQQIYHISSQQSLSILLSFITPNGSTDKNAIIYTKCKNTFTKQNIKKITNYDCIYYLKNAVSTKCRYKLLRDVECCCTIAVVVVYIAIMIILAVALTLTLVVIAVGVIFYLRR